MFVKDEFLFVDRLLLLVGYKSTSGDADTAGFDAGVALTRPWTVPNRGHVDATQIR